jgi:hypothetical protein
MNSGPLRTGMIASLVTVAVVAWNETKWAAW